MLRVFLLIIRSVMKAVTYKIALGFLALSICFMSVASAALPARVDAIINRLTQEKVEFSVQIVKADTGRVLYSHNGHEPMIPASNMKLITTAAALKFLAPDFEFNTRVALCGDTLVVIGSGDPLLGDEPTDAKHNRKPGWIFNQIAAALKQRRISQINDIVVDTTIFDDVPVHPNWPKKQLNRWYAAEVCGLNYNGNCMRISAKTAAGNAVISVEPQTGFLTISNDVKVITSGTSVIGSYRQPQTNNIVVFGRCNKTAGPFDVAIEKPALFFGYLLAENLVKAGIKTTGELLEKAVEPHCHPNVIAEFRHSLQDCLARCNKDSFGLAAESLLKTVAATSTQTGKNGGWAGGRRIVSKYLTDIGIPPGQFYIDDASGLSRQNELSAIALVTVLLDVYRSPNWQMYRDSLAAGGQDGTIAKYFKQKKYKGKIRGKTGYISGVKSFSGVCSTGHGEYLFSILANGSNGKTREAINDIAKAIIDEAQSASAKPRQNPIPVSKDTTPSPTKG
jgi:D-alanyl-D-alanine carboxypeptidase/D-alanyl-D-alanine-endopeptidase (penicillin-binding protein 4)